MASKNIEVCGRCGGGGNISVYNHIQNGRCFGCGGSGYVIGRRAATRDEVFSFLRPAAPEVVVEDGGLTGFDALLFALDNPPAA